MIRATDGWRVLGAPLFDTIGDVAYGLIAETLVSQHMLRQAVHMIEKLLHWHRAQESLSPTGEERRVWIRHRADGDAVCRPANDAVGLQRQPARVRNVSRGGVNLITQVDFEPGALLLVELPGSGEEPAMALAYVIHSSALPDNEWSLGCSFAAELSEEDMARFDAQRVRSTAPDKRGWVRFPCNLEASYRPLGEEQRVGVARVMDISPSGVGLSVAEPIDVGTLLNLELRSADAHTLSMLACVVRSTQKGEERVIGCNFIRELTDLELDACCQLARR